MANIDPAPSWAPIRQLETTDRNLAGPGGVLNTQPVSIAARLNLLRDNATALNNTVAGISSRQDAADSAIASLESQVLDAPGTLSDLDHGAPISVTGDQFPDVLSIDNSRGPVLALNESISDLAQRDEWLKAQIEALPETFAEDDGASKIGYMARTVFDRLGDIYSLKDAGAKGDGVTDDTIAYKKAVDACTISGKIMVVPAGQYVLTDGISVTCKITHWGDVTYLCTLPEGVDAFVFSATNTIVNDISFTSDAMVNIRMNGTGRDGIRLRKFEGMPLGPITVYDPFRASLNVEPGSSFDLMENLYCPYFKAVGGKNWLRVRIPNMPGVFANLFSFVQFEGRGCTEYPVHVIFDGGTTQGQAAAEWFFGTFEADTGQDSTSPINDIFYAERINGATQGLAQSWVMNALVLENTRGTSPKVHVNGFNCLGTTNLWNSLRVLTCDRYNVTNGLSAVVSASMGRVTYNESGRINTNSTGNYSSIMRGGFLADRIVLDNSLQTNSGATTEFNGALTANNVSRLVTQFAGGNSNYTANETKNAYSIGTEIGATTGYEVHRIRVMASNAETADYCEFLALANAGVVTVSRIIGTKFTAAVSGGFVTITNTDTVSKTVRLARTREI